jgi:alpha-1,4-digalacturonate transport system substrate-binding protein
LPAHAEVARQGVPYQTENSQLFDGLMAFNAEVLNLDDAAYDLQFHPFAFAYTRNAANRITQYLTGELTMDEMIEILQEDIDTAIAEAP